MSGTRGSIPAHAIPKSLEVEMNAERMAQVDSVMRIVNEAIEKLKISLVLPRVLENPITLRQYLKGSKYEKCVEIVESYLKEKKLDQVHMEPQQNYHLLRVIDMFHENYQMLSVLPKWLDDMSPEDKSLLNAFSLLQNITEQRLGKSATEELDKEKRIHTIYHDNEQMKRNIAEFQSRLRNQKINLRWKLAAKDGVIKKYEDDLAFRKWDNNISIKEEIGKSSRRVRTIHANSIIKQKELEEELEKTKATYEKVLKQNLHHEKEVRDEKLRNQKINLRWKLAAKDGVIKKYEDDLAFRKWDNNISIKEEIGKSSRRVRTIHANSIIKQKELEEELEKTKATYEKVLKQNLHHEKEVRDEKNKLLLQLQALVRKFDQNIGEKIKENIYLQEVYDEQKRQFDEFFVEYQREEAEYEAIIRTKEEEDRRSHEEKLWLFMATRAAKIIQRAWRRFRRANMKPKGKGKGGKGGKGKKK